MAVARDDTQRFTSLAPSGKGSFLKQLAALLPKVVDLDIIFRELVAQHRSIFRELLVSQRVGLRDDRYDS